MPTPRPTPSAMASDSLLLLFELEVVVDGLELVDEDEGLAVCDGRLLDGAGVID